MINRKLLILLFFSSYLCFSCHKKAATQTIADEKTFNDKNNEANENSSQMQANDTEVKQTDIKNVTIDVDANIMLTGDVYKMDSVWINGDILTANISYSGGCKEHIFDLVSTGMYAKSLPPQIRVCLQHKGNEDACRMFIKRELKFNISQLRYKGAENTIVILGDKYLDFKK